jgi:hypothetical protein
MNPYLIYGVLFALLVMTWAALEAARIRSDERIAMKALGKAKPKQRPKILAKLAGVLRRQLPVPQPPLRREDDDQVE